MPAGALQRAGELDFGDLNQSSLGCSRQWQG